MKKRKSPLNEIKLDRFLHLIKYFSLFLILFFCLLLFKCKTHASSGDITTYFPMEQNENSIISDSFINYCQNQFNFDTNYILICYYGKDNNYYNVCVYVIPKEYAELYSEILSNGYQFSPYIINVSGNLSDSTVNNYCRIYYYDVRISDSAVWTNGSTIFQYNTFNSSSYNVNNSYLSNFRLYTSNNSNNRQTVLKLGWELPPDFFHDESHATPPDTFESPLYTTGHTPPTNVPPTYTINNYSWTTYTPPTIDTSNAETLLESIYNAIVYNGQYLKDNIHGELTNLVDNIGGFVEYIGDTIQYYGNLIISNIQNGITTFYNNINSAVVGIGNMVSYITQPLDMDNLTNAVNSTHIWGDVDTCTTFASDAFGIYGTVAEPNSFKIPLDLRSISLLNITQVYYIDLSWLDGAKTAIRAFMWCVVTFGLLYSIIVDIPNMIRSSK